jgi:hypothetical protein
MAKHQIQEEEVNKRELGKQVEVLDENLHAIREEAYVTTLSHR